jgi:C-terminal processing protease CtpA/Prc
MEPSSYPELGKEDIITKVKALLAGKTQYQHYIYTRVKEANEMFLTANALDSFGYSDQATECIIKAMEYSGFSITGSDEQTQESPIVAMIVINIVEDSEAERIGLQQGDAIVAVNGGQIISVEDLTGALAENNGETQITVNRNGKEIYYQVTTQKLGVGLFPLTMKLLDHLQAATLY